MKNRIVHAGNIPRSGLATLGRANGCATVFAADGVPAIVMAGREVPDPIPGIAA